MSFADYDQKIHYSMLVCHFYMSGYLVKKKKSYLVVPEGRVMTSQKSVGVILRGS